MCVGRSRLHVCLKLGSGRMGDRRILGRDRSRLVFCNAGCSRTSSEKIWSIPVTPARRD